MTTPINVDRKPESPASETPAAEHLALHAGPELLACAEAAHQAFLKAIETALANEFTVNVEATFNRTEQSFISQYRSDEDAEFVSVVMAVEPGVGCAVLRFSSWLLHKVLDLLLASPADAPNERESSLTEIEFHLLGNLFKLFASALEASWSAIPDVKFLPVAERSEALFAAHSEDFAMALKSVLRIDGVEGTFDVVIPCFMARLAARQGFSAGRKAGDQIATALASAKVEMEVVLSGLTIRLGDLAELAPGQILLADRVSDSTFGCSVNEQVRFTGEVVSMGDHYAFQLTGPTSSKE